MEAQKVLQILSMATSRIPMGKHRTMPSKLYQAVRMRSLCGKVAAFPRSNPCRSGKNSFNE